jgi:acyl-CoA reductase-like NAD-dependent aldehyde dehydrogenase
VLRQLSSFTESFIANIKGQMFIEGRWVKSLTGRTLSVFNPSTGTIITEIADADVRDVHDAVNAGRRALEAPNWSRVAAKQRETMLRRLADLMRTHADHFAELEALDNGKSVSIARTIDVEKAIDWFEYFAGWPSKLQGRTIPENSSERLVYTLREPIGVVGQIIPWNYPLMMAAWKVAPALAAGCTIVLKPAEETPLSALLLGQLACEAGFPPGVLNVITGTGETAGVALVEHPGLDKIAFTGSTQTGQEIMRRSARHVRPLTLELGGNSPNIVLPDANPLQIAAHLASAAFANHGQNCCAGARLFVPSEFQNIFLDSIISTASQIRLGPGLDPETQMGPLVSQVQKGRVTNLIDQAKESGAELAYSGVIPSGNERGYFVGPTIIVGAGDQSRIVREEIFGPVITVLPYDSLDEVIHRANATEYGLAAGIWTQNLRTAHTLAARVKAGTVWINTYNETSPAVPFGGFKHSGIGREHGEEILNHYTETKSVWVSLT